MKALRNLTLCVVLVFVFAFNSHSQPPRWTEAKAGEWYQHQPWPVGSNYVPVSAINQLEMWQADTFQPGEMDKELGWAQGLGMTTMRVFLHDLLWEQDPAGFQERMKQFLIIATRHKIRPIFVLFDSCWDPYPKLGPQHPPVPGVHNSGWVQSPGRAALEDSRQYPRLKQYVQGVIGPLANDDRVLAWDLWNEPDNTNDTAYGKVESKDKQRIVLALLPQIFAWARQVHPSQPLTSGVWKGDWSSPEKMDAMTKLQLEESDVISFHHYGWPEDFEQRIIWLEVYHRPLLCTEYMARGAGSTFDTILPIAKKYKVAAINWGFVAGKTQTYLPWDSWERPYVLSPPPIWFHDIFYADGRPYRQREADLIRELTAASAE